MDKNTRVNIEELGLATVAGRTRDGKVVVAPDNDDDIFDIIAEDALNLLKTPSEIDEEIQEALAFAKAQYKQTKDTELRFVKTLIADLIKKIRESIARAYKDVIDARDALKVEAIQLQMRLKDDIADYHSGRRF